MRLLIAAGLLSLALPGIGQNGNKAKVDFQADLITSVPVGDSTALSLVGHVVFFHNGAVITCDSAIRYNDRLMDCYRNVVINKDSTFVYGDKADYNGETNEARVYAPLVKMVDKDATLYTYNFVFNTLTNIGRYFGGGTLSQKDNLMESVEGYYYSDTRELVGVRDVEMRSPEYILKSDSVLYNLDTEIARFHTLSYIWNDQDEFLTARRGSYDNRNDLYTFTDSSYMMTKTQQIWADTITYRQKTQDARLVNNIQIMDEEQKALAFGDYGQYWGEEKKALLTRNPVVGSYEQGQNADTVFIRADTIFLFTIDRFADSLKKETAAPPTSETDSVGHSALPEDSLSAGTPTLPRPASGRRPVVPRNSDSTALTGPADTLPEAPATQPDSLGEPPVPDSLAVADSVGVELTPKELKKQQAEQERKEKEKLRKEKDAERAAKIKAKAQEAREKAQAILRAQQEREEARQRKDLARRFAKGKATSEDSLALLRLDSLADHRHDSIAAADSTQTAAAVPADSTQAAADSLAVAPGDSIVRIVKAFHHVRIFRPDFQAVCDSLVAFSADSTIHLYIDPVLWNENNQVTSQVVDVYTKNQTIERAVFTGEPMMSSEVDPKHYNQVTGKNMEAFFRDGEIYKNDVKGNAQTYYFMEEGDSTDRHITGFLVASSADISFRFTDRELVSIYYYGKPDWTMYPLDKIPETQSLVMQGFKWEAERRPSRKDVFDRSVRASLRSHYEGLGKPLYPITERIGKERERLIRSGWIERNDRYITPEAEEFVRSLGY